MTRTRLSSTWLSRWSWTKMKTLEKKKRENHLSKAKNALFSFQFSFLPFFVCFAQMIFASSFAAGGIRASEALNLFYGTKDFQKSTGRFLCSNKSYSYMMSYIIPHSP